MDLTIPIKNIKLNIRTGILLNTPEGFIFERDKRNSALFPIGGRVKTEEDSKSAIIREVKEETGLILESVKFHSIIEKLLYTRRNKIPRNIIYVRDGNKLCP